MSAVRSKFKPKKENPSLRSVTRPGFTELDRLAMLKRGRYTRANDDASSNRILPNETILDPESVMHFPPSYFGGYSKADFSFSSSGSVDWFSVYM